MDITKYPQFELYLLTLNLLRFKNQLIPIDCDERCINSTIINRAFPEILPVLINFAFH
ncbi:MAG: hypothetical protein J6P09_09810 [Methanobrevibacter sp.]|uniref:hypothetical protein n=1 Tax=Methanobrevibacter sp. TaxID=66852 RepID=UPI001B1E85D4|nr:hypothetical protein [Methanobrevibacter sp.]MBO6124120.1 hypothetical protein [Methanobrevibacter sp.]MBP3791362.1 hypothetical protein [Methanobrevibacter sp.]